MLAIQSATATLRISFQPDFEGDSGRDFFNNIRQTETFGLVVEAIEAYDIPRDYLFGCSA